jgi:DNA-binding LytR/AlgR family response regulator
MIKAIAVDDEPPALEIVANFCSKIEFIGLEKTFTKTEEAFQYIKDHPVDLIFLDINMPALSGIDFYKKIPQKILVIFTTAYTEFAIEAFNLKAIDYLLKPFTFQRFLAAAEKANEIFHFKNQTQPEPKPEVILLRVGYSLVKVFVADIIFIEGLDDYLKIHLRQQKPLVVRMTMKAMLEKLPPSDFIRVHRSYIISLHYIDSVRNKVISIADEEVPIGNSYEAAFLAHFNNKKI